MLTKKRLASITAALSVLYTLLLFLLLPPEVVAPRSDNMILFAFKVIFLSMTASVVTSILLVPVFRRAFIKRQIDILKRFRYLLFLLVKRDFVKRYRRSVLGILWSILSPLLTMLIMTAVFSFVFRNQIQNFPVYLLSGQIIFMFFSESTTEAMQSLISNEGILRKVYVPKYVFPVSRVISSLVQLFFSFLAFIIVFVITRAPFHWTMLLISVPIIYVFVFSMGIAMLLSSMTVFFRDMIYLYKVGITMLTYLTPLFYPISIIPERFQPFMGLNPMYQFVDYFRSLALYGIVPGLWANGVCLGFALASLCLGTYVFMSQQNKYILYL